MVLKILDVKKKSLRMKSKLIPKIDKKILSLVEDMKDTLAAQKDPEGVGLAAPQVGSNVRLFLIKYGNNEKVIINPKIIKVQDKPLKTNSSSRRRSGQKLLEGCLSLPHYYGPLTRANMVKLEYMDIAGKNVLEDFSGFLAQIVLHEIDHLDGVLFIDRILEQNVPLYHFHGEDWEEVELT